MNDALAIVDAWQDAVARRYDYESGSRSDNRIYRSLVSGD